MAKLVEDIISLSHLDEGATDLHFETTDLFSIADSVVASLAQEADDANVTFTLSGEQAVLSGIPQLLFGIVYNLCDNAVKYNRKHGDVFIKVKNQADSVILTVRDTGIGIPPEHQEPVFERFYRVDKSHSKDLGGTGLGLSIVKHAAKIHKADIRLESAPGNGTKITIVFPK
jgi:two-component system phosphate regulon sensor histidine kinase PhoR